MPFSLVSIVLIPLLAAPVCAFLSTSFRAQRLAVGAAWSSFLCVIYSAFFASSQNSVYFFGGWSASIGISYKGEGVQYAILLFVSFLGSICLSFHHKEAGEKACLFYSLFLLSLSGLLGIVITDDLFNSYVFMEVASLASCSLIAHSSKKKAPHAGFTYLLIGTIGASLFLWGIGFFYQMTHVLHLSELMPLLIEGKHHPIIQAGIVFMSLGLMLKSAIFPLHFWLCHVYKHGSMPFIAFLSGTSGLVMFYVWMRIVLPLLDVNGMILFWCLHILAVASIIVGSTGAFLAKNTKELLAYSTVAHGGFMCIGIALGSKEGLIAVLCQMITHGLAKTHLFLSLEMKKPSLIGVANLLGLPFTFGFVSKWLLLKASVQAEDWYAVMILAFGSFLALLYSVSFLKKEPFHAHIFTKRQQWMMIFLGIVTFGCGLYPQFLLSLLMA